MVADDDHGAAGLVLIVNCVAYLLTAYSHGEGQIRTRVAEVQWQRCWDLELERAGWSHRIGAVQICERLCFQYGWALFFGEAEIDAIG